MVDRLKIQISNNKRNAISQQSSLPFWRSFLYLLFVTTHTLYTYIYIYVYIHIYMYACVYVYIYIHTYTYSFFMVSSFLITMYLHCHFNGSLIFLCMDDHTKKPEMSFTFGYLGCLFSLS